MHKNGSRDSNGYFLKEKLLLKVKKVDHLVFIYLVQVFKNLSTACASARPPRAARRPGVCCLVLAAPEPVAR